MMYWNGDWNWAAWAAMTASMLVFWGAVVWIAIAVMRSPSNNEARRAEDILAERFAHGDIDEDEYTRRRNALRSDP